jgi:adenine-specific DNA-methyltransferase
MAPDKKPPIPVESLTHQDRRPNIPTEELRDFVKKDENKPGAMLYPRDPSLDPQLVWKGKDEQDRPGSNGDGALGVPVVPVYIQEKIKPQALIENLRNTARLGEAEPELTLFDNFDGLEFEDLIDFYQHDQNWSNRMILGDSLLVMASLAEKEGFKGKVQTIYMDPPYGIKFGSNWQVSTRKRDVKDGKLEDATRQPEQIKAFRDTWELGIHSYLTYLRDRLTVARDLLTESGSVFVQIGDENVHLVRCLLDEVFGAENFVSQIVFRKTAAPNSPMAKLNSIGSVGDYVLQYAKDCEKVKYRQLFAPLTAAEFENYNCFEAPDGSVQTIVSAQDEVGSDSRLSLSDTSSMGPAASFCFAFAFRGKTYYPTPGRHWSTKEEGLHRLACAGRLHPKANRVFYKRRATDFPVRPLAAMWDDTQFGGYARDEQKVYVVQTLGKVIERCLLMTTDPGDLVLDPTCGSGTTAYVAEQWGRRWITVDTSRVALALARTRLMAAKYPYYLLADSADGQRKDAEVTGQVAGLGAPVTNDVRKGFVYKRVPHVTLKSIANNPDIREGMTRDDIDAAIARHADTELLFDQPYEDNKRIRVTGPFTVESLSPHRVLAADGGEPASERQGKAEDASGQFELMIIDNLRKAGVQNTVKNERLRFDRLEPYAGTWLQAAGEYTDAADKVRRVAVSVGPQYGTVGKEQVKEAAKEAVQGLGFDILVICGFAFDPLVPEETRRFGDLTVLTARMNPDLLMGEELLKKTGAGNLFMVFGEPDIGIERRDGKVTVELHGLDLYDPTTGELRSNSTDEIACWFIDTNYNGESFFVRHAYFTGDSDPYQKLKRALKAEIDEAAWESLYSTTSRPFAPPETGRIAVKVINHYGDEVLKVYEVGAR